MKQQDYKNHIQFWYPHHFIFYPIIIALIAISCVYASKNSGQSMMWAMMAIAFSLVGWVSFMMRQHYSLTNQDRLIRLELRLRYYQLTNQKLESIENKISFSQLAALRFAPDEELVPLIERVLKENLSGNEIKKSIINWLPDNMRV